MKKILFSFLLTLIFIGVHAQCTPDPQYTAVGIYPDSTTGLPNAVVGQAYNEVITVISPLDTTVEIFGQQIPVTVTTIELTSVTGLPSSFSYDCAGGNCVFAGGSTSCAVLTSNGPLASEMGLHQLEMTTLTTVDAGLFGSQTQTDVIDYYYIEVNMTNSSVNQFDDFTFELKDIFPNPVNNQSKIQFINSEKSNVLFSVFNYLGEKVYEENISSIRGINDIIIDADAYSDGIYLYSITNGNKIITKRMLIAN